MFPLKLFSTTHGGAHRSKPPPRWVVSERDTILFACTPERFFRIYFQSKVAACSWCVSAQTWAQSRRERERDIDKHRQRGEREREERSPFPLSDAGRFEERTWGDAQTRISMKLNNTQHMILRINWQWALMEVRWSLCCSRIFVSWGCCDAQDKAAACQKFAGKRSFYARWKQDKVTSISSQIVCK